MTKVTLTDLVNLQNETTSVSTLNSNNTTVETAFDNTLSRDGTSPNEMEAPLDMNNNRILNLPAPTQASDPVRLSDLTITYVANSSLFPTPSISNVTQMLRINDAGTQYELTNIGVNSSGHMYPFTSTQTLGKIDNPWQNFYLRNTGFIDFGDGSTSNLRITHSTGRLTINGDLALGSGKYIEVQDISTPGTPTGGIIRLYSKLVSGVSQLHMKVTSGSEVRISYPPATQAIMETGTSQVDTVTPGVQHYHPAHPKAWARITGGTTPSITTSYGVSAVSRPAQGRLLVTLSPAMSNNQYCIIASVMRTTTSMAEANVLNVTVRNASQTLNQFELECIDQTATTCIAVDPTAWYFTIFGDQ